MKYVNIFAEMDFYDACKDGNMDLVKSMIDSGKYDLESCLEYACESGNIDIVKLMIKKDIRDFNDGLHGACIGGNMDIVNLIIDSGATRYSDEQLIEFKKSKEFNGLNGNIIKMILNKY